MGRGGRWRGARAAPSCDHRSQSRWCAADAFVGYLRHAYIAQPCTIYREAAKLPPGHILTLRESSNSSLQCFWDLRRIATTAQRRNDRHTDANEDVERLDALLRDSVSLQ